MPTYIRKLTPTGLRRVEYTAASLTEAAQYEPHDGVYTVTNTYHLTQVLLFDAHLDRMEDSARRADILLTIDRARLRAALCQMIIAAGFGNVRFRVTVSRSQPDVFILSLEPYKPPPKDLVIHGVRVVTAPNSARHNAAAKTTDWMHDRQRLNDLLKPGIYDVILLDANGDMMEGLAANFYAIVDGTLRTAGAGVLPGIAQKIVFTIAPPILPVDQTPVNIRDLSTITEAFITSSSRGIIPVVEIDGHPLGDGTPGPFTRRLLTAYNVWVNTHLEEL